jgi:hypothetical protein
MQERRGPCHLGLSLKDLETRIINLGVENRKTPIKNKILGQIKSMKSLNPKDSVIRKIKWKSIWIWKRQKQQKPKTKKQKSKL